VKVDRITWDGADAAGLARRLRSAAAPPPGVAAEAARIVADVRRRGDAALRELTSRLDATDIPPTELTLRVDPSEIERARAEADPALLGALEVAARNVSSVARAELEARSPVRVELPQGQIVSLADSPVAAAGIYAPAGRAAYPSTVLMCCVPARVAGVDRVVVVAPPGRDGRLPGPMLAACAVAGVDEAYAVGGAQAIAALAYGTESIAPVDMIAGPGNHYVNAAKRVAFGDAGVDGIAGPTELMVLLDGAAEVRALALDLLAQAEHGADGLLAAAGPDADALADLESQLGALASERPTVSDATATLVVVPDLSAAVELADAIAPEHLELAFEAADARVAADRVAGAVFLGPGGAAAFGDYVAGSNHVLPTGGAARFGGPLGVGAFQRRTSVVEVPADAVSGLAPRVATLARAEGFDVHAESAEARGGE
jgi:histidinol dehydrogenase